MRSLPPEPLHAPHNERQSDCTNDDDATLKSNAIVHLGTIISNVPDMLLNQCPIKQRPPFEHEAAECAMDCLGRRSRQNYLIRRSFLIRLLTRSDALGWTSKSEGTFRIELIK